MVVFFVLEYVKKLEFSVYLYSKSKSKRRGKNQVEAEITQTLVDNMSSIRDVVSIPYWFGITFSTIRTFLTIILELLDFWQFLISLTK